MGRQNVYETLTGSTFMPRTSIEELVDFLVLNRHYILPADRQSEAFKTRSFSHTLMSDLIYRLSASGGDRAYSLLKLPSKTVALREAVDNTFVPIDLLQMSAMTSSSAKTLSLIPELNDKLVINITDITKADGSFLDSSRFYQRVVRDFLSRNYYNSTGSAWISTALVRYVAKVYSMTIGAKLAKFFGLSPNVHLFIQTLFALFFVGRMTSDDVAPAFLKANAKLMYLPQGEDLSQILAMVQEVLGRSTPGTLEDVFKVIDTYSHGQLVSGNKSRLDRPVLNQNFASLASDKPVGMLALEYPPYFLFLIMLVLSGERIGLAFPMKQLSLLNEGHTVLDQLVKTPQFLNIHS